MTKLYCTIFLSQKATKQYQTILYCQHKFQGCLDKVKDALEVI